MNPEVLLGWRADIQSIEILKRYHTVNLLFARQPRANMSNTCVLSIVICC